MPPFCLNWIGIYIFRSNSLRRNSPKTIKGDYLPIAVVSKVKEC